MDLFRCPTCLGILTEPEAERCPTCNQRLRKKAPIVLDAAGRPDEEAGHHKKLGRRRRGRRFGSRVE